MFGITEFFKKCFWAINIFNVIISIILISVGTHCKNAVGFGSIPIIGGIIACGVLLFLITAFGFFAAYGKNQTFLFYFMIGIGVLFIIQISVAIACVQGGDEKDEKVLAKHWEKFDTPKKHLKLREAELKFECCGLNGTDQRFNITNIEDYWKEERDFCKDEILGCQSITSTTRPTTQQTTTVPSTTTQSTTLKTTTKAPKSTTDGSGTTASESPTQPQTSPPKPTTSVSPTTVKTSTSTVKPSGPTAKSVIRKNLLRRREDNLKMTCPTCHDQMIHEIHHSFNTCGGLGIFFSLFLPLTIFVTFQFRAEINKQGF